MRLFYEYWIQPYHVMFNKKEEGLICGVVCLFCVKRMFLVSAKIAHPVFRSCSKLYENVNATVLSFAPHSHGVAKPC